MHPQRSARPARPPPPLQHPIPTHPKAQVPELSMQNTFHGEDASTYAPPQPNYTPQARAPPKKRESYTRISSPRGGTPVHAPGYAPQQRPNPGFAPHVRPPTANTPQQRQVPNAYAPPRANSNASVVPNMNTYQSTAAPYFEGASTPDTYPNVPPYAAPLQDPYTRDDAWNLGGQSMPALGGGMMNDATAQMGMQFGRHVAQVGGEYMQKNVRIVG